MLAVRLASEFQLVISGEPKGKQRARHGQGKTFTPHETKLAEQEIRRAWEEAGCPVVEGAIVLDVDLGVTRPKGHFTTKGELSAEGKRNPHPHRRKPDVDNALKLVMDALNQRAWGDDVQVIEATVARQWAEIGFTEVNVHTIKPIA